MKSGMKKHEEDKEGDNNSIVYSDIADEFEY